MKQEKKINKKGTAEDYPGVPSVHKGADHVPDVPEPPAVTNFSGDMGSWYGLPDEKSLLESILTIYLDRVDLNIRQNNHVVQWAIKKDEVVFVFSRGHKVTIPVS